MKRIGAGVLLLAALAAAQPAAAQTRERGPWWPSVHGKDDQAGASNYVTPAKILAALAIPKTGQTYELGHPYETSMPNTARDPSKYNDSFIGTGENQGSPGIGVEVANWLIERKAGLVGGDSCCVEVRGPVPKESVHHLLFLGHGIPLLENLDLAELVRDQASVFLFLGLPERIKGATGSLIRIAVR